MATLILVNLGVMTFLSLKRLIFVNAKRAMSTRKARRIQIAVDAMDDPTVSESVDEAGERIHSLDDDAAGALSRREKKMKLSEDGQERDGEESKQGRRLQLGLLSKMAGLAEMGGDAGAHRPI